MTPSYAGYVLGADLAAFRAANPLGAGCDLLTCHVAGPHDLCASCRSRLTAADRLDLTTCRPQHKDRAAAKRPPHWPDACRFCRESDALPLLQGASLPPEPDTEPAPF